MRAYGRAAEGVRATQNSTRAAQAQPRWTLAFLAILGYMFVEYSNLSLMYPILQPLKLGKILVALSVVGFLASPRLRADVRSGSRGIDFTLFVFLLACFLSVLSARYQPIAWEGLADVFRWVLLYYLFSRILTNSWRLRILVFLMLLLNLKMAQFAIRYYFMELSWGRSEQFLSVHGVGAGTTSFFGNAGDFGVAMCVVWPIAGSLLFGEPKKLPRLLLLACFTAFFLAILLCGSRGAVAGAAATALAAWGINPKRIGGTVMVLFVFLGAYYFLPEANKERMRSALHWEADETSRQRIELWNAGLRMFEDHPILGVGLGNFTPTYQTVYAPDSTRNPSAWAPHSIYIQALSELGLVGSLPLLMLWLLFLRLNARTRHHLQALGLGDRRSFEYRLSLGLDLALVGYMVSGAFLTVLYYPHLWFLLGLNAGLHTACLRKQPEIGLAQFRNQKRKFALAPG